MHLVFSRTRDPQLVPAPETRLPHGRTIAIGYLDDQLAAGRLGLDPYDPTVVLLDVGRNEAVWGRIVIELTGLHLSTCDQPDGLRYRMILEADVREELGLDEHGAPVLRNEPLASRRIVDEGLRLLEQPGPKTEVVQAIADARDKQREAQEQSA